MVQYLASIIPILGLSLSASTRVLRRRPFIWGKAAQVCRRCTSWKSYDILEKLRWHHIVSSSRFKTILEMTPQDPPKVPPRGGRPHPLRFLRAKWRSDALKFSCSNIFLPRKANGFLYFVCDLEKGVFGQQRDESFGTLSRRRTSRYYCAQC